MALSSYSKSQLQQRNLKVCRAISGRKDIPEKTCGTLRPPESRKGVKKKINERKTATLSSF